MAESQITKRAIADSLKELSQTKAFNKITIKDITDKCGVNRQTFYYHFEDKYKLLQWIYQYEFFEVYLKGMNFDNWDEKMLVALKAIRKDKKFYINTVEHAEKYLMSFILQEMQNIFSRAVEKLDEKNKVDSEQRQFIARFFAYGVCGVIIDWAYAEMVEEPEFIVENMKRLLIHSERAAYTHISEDMK